VYAILPRWSSGRFEIKDFGAQRPGSVSLLGGGPVKWRAGRNILAIDLPELPEALRKQPAYVIKISR